MRYVIIRLDGHDWRHFMTNSVINPTPVTPSFIAVASLLSNFLLVSWLSLISSQTALESANDVGRPSMTEAKTMQLYFCLLIANLNSCINGYDGSLMSAINAIDQYREYFNFPLDKGTPGTGIVYAIYTVGNLVGSFAAGPATDWKGWSLYQNQQVSI